ncbi:MAG: HAD hydrolase-like protein [Kiritimatiellales bacterium]
MKNSWSKNDLIHFDAKHDVLVALDSDGCVFDSMTIKQQIFHTGIIRFWQLENEEKEFRRIAEWTALYSQWRGLNRFELLLKIFQNMKTAVPYFPALTRIPNTAALEQFINSGRPLSTDELEKFMIVNAGDDRAITAPAGCGDNEDLRRILNWSRAVNIEIAGVKEMPVFAEVETSLQKIRRDCDVIVVSQTAEEALVHEWRNAGLEKYIDVIAGAELGSKKSTLQTIMCGRYAPAHMLMVGDAPGDLAAARSAGVNFFPIIPGDESASWIELRNTALKRITAGNFAGEYQTELIDRFHAALPFTPPWKKN